MSTNLVSVTIGPPSPDFSEKEGPQWLYVTHKAGQTPAENAEDAWYAYLIAGAYGTQCSAKGADCLAGYTVESSDGPQEDDGEGQLVMQSVLMKSASPEEVSSSIEANLAAEGITPSSISFEKPLGLAPIVEIQSSDPQATVTALNTSSVFNGLGLDGFLVRITDRKGSVVYIEDGAFRSQAGQGWVQPGLKVPNIP